MSFLKHNQIYTEKNFIFLIFSLIPFSAIFSRFFLEFFLLILSLIFLKNIFKNKDFKIFKDNKIIFFIIFYIYIIVSYNLQNENYYDKIYLYIRFIFYYISVLYFLKKLPELFIFFIKSISISLFILGLDSIYQFIFGQNIFGYQILENGRITSFFKDESILAGYIRIFLPLFLILFLIKKKKLLLLITLFLSLAAAILSGERINFIMIIFVIISSICYFFKGSFLKKILPLNIIFILILTSFLTLNQSYKERYIARTLNELSKSYQLNKQIWDDGEGEFKLNFYIYSGYHTNLYRISYKAFLEKKYFGHGPRSFREFCLNKKYSKRLDPNLNCSTHPHNYFMQFLSELGLIGAGFLLFSYFYFIYKTIFYFLKRSNNLIEKISFFPCLNLVIILTPFIPSGNFFNNYISCLFFVSLSIFSYFEYLSNNKEKL